jgi:hypothetical protein
MKLYLSKNCEYIVGAKRKFAVYDINVLKYLAEEIMMNDDNMVVQFYIPYFDFKWM